MTALVGNILLNLAGGFVSGFNVKTTTPHVPLAPPKILFPIVWTALYIILGFVAGKLIEQQDELLLFLYYTQLALNLLWTPLFFSLNMKKLAAIVIVVMLVMSSYIAFTDGAVTGLLIPYLVWLTFALYLNIATIIYKQ